MGKSKISLVGQKFNRLLATEELPYKIKGHRYFICKCDCGNTCTISYSHLKALRQKTCGCLLYRTWENSPFFDGIGQISYSWWKGHVLRENTKGNSRQKHKVEISIEYAWNLFLKQDKKCALTGVSLQFGNTSSRNTASLDRIDSTIGYLVDNVQWVHKDINWMKNKFKLDKFIYLCKQVASHNNDNKQETQLLSHTSAGDS